MAFFFFAVWQRRRKTAEENRQRYMFTVCARITKHTSQTWTVAEWTNCVGKWVKSWNCSFCQQLLLKPTEFGTAQGVKDFCLSLFHETDFSPFFPGKTKGEKRQQNPWWWNNVMIAVNAKAPDCTMYFSHIYFSFCCPAERWGMQGRCCTHMMLTMV